MPSPALILWADSSRNALAAAWQSNLDSADIDLRQGDSIGVELHWVRRTNSLSSVMEEVEWPVSANITLAIGKLDLAPTSGTFSLSYGAYSTSELGYGCTAVQMETALNALSSIASDGGVTVSKTATSYRILWNDMGVASATLAVNSNDLTPTSSIGVAVARAGSLSARNLVQLHIKQSPVAVCTSWATQDAPVVTVTQTHAPAYSGDFRVWRIKISPAPKSGSFRLSKTINSVVTWSVPIDAIPSASDITSAIGLDCSQVGINEYEVVQPQVTGESTVNITAIGADSAGLIPYQSKYGVLNLNTLDLELMMAGAASVNAILEIEVDVDGSRETIVQKQVRVLNDLIDTDSYTLTNWGEVIPADSVVRYDTSQALTTPQKTQARLNIGAISSAELGSYATKDTELEGRLGTIEAALSTNVQAALAGANAPSSTNVVATMDDISGFADAVHTHAIADVTGLQTALDSKVSATHTHSIAQVTDLQTALDDLDANKSNTGHSHTTSEVAGLDTQLTSINSSISSLQFTAPTEPEKAALSGSSSPSYANPFVTLNYLENTDRFVEVNPNTGTLTGTLYPNEIVVRVGGVYYAIPARLF